MRLAVVAALGTAGCQAIFPLVEPVPDNDGANIAFITSGVHSGALGGLAGGDQICQDAADNVGLAGTYVAWLSTGAPRINAVDRLTGSRGWVRVDGAPVADLPTDLGIRGPLVPLSVTESGIDVRGGGPSWTGTDGNGGGAAETCGDWTVASPATGHSGDSTFGLASFTFTQNLDCGTAARLYCFGTGNTIELAIPPSSDPILFVSDRKFTGTDGVAAADQICRDEAMAAGLPGTYLAAIAAAGTSVRQRFATDHDYVRVDGLRVGHFLTTTTPATFPMLTATGTALADLTWTGGPLSTASSGGDDCSSWLGGLGGIVGDSHAGTGLAFSAGSDVCASGHHVYCLQE